MATRPYFPVAIVAVVVTVLMTGCSSYRATPVDARSAGTLRPDIEDADVGLVGIAPGFDLRQYHIIVVELFEVAPNEIKDAQDVSLAKEMSGYLQASIVAKMK